MRLYNYTVGLCMYRSLVVHCKCFSLSVTARLGLNTTIVSTTCVHLPRGQQTPPPTPPPRGSNQPSALIRDIHLSAGGEFFSIFNLIV